MAEVMIDPFKDGRFQRGRWGLCLAAVLLAAPLPAQSPQPATVDWGAVQELIEESRLDEAFERFRGIDPTGFDTGSHERAAELLGLIASKAEEAGQDRLAVNALIALAQTQTELALYRAARTTLEQAERLWRRDPDPATGVDLWSAHAVRLTYQREPAAAMDYSRRALEQARELGDSQRVGRLLVNLGQSQLQLYDHAGAIDAFNEALSLEIEDTRRIIALASLGIAWYELNQFDEAEQIFERARSMAVEMGNRRLEAWAIGELATTLMRPGRDAGLALSKFDESITLFAELGDVRNEAIFLGNRARLLRDLGQYQQALATNLEAERRLQSIEGQPRNPITTKNIADCLALLDRPDEAEVRYREAIGLAREHGEQKAHWQAAFGLARLHRRLGLTADAEADYAEALGVIESVRGGLRLESFKTDFFEDKIEVYEGYVDLLLSDDGAPDREARAFEVAERARARAFLDTLAETRANLHETLPAGILRDEEELLGRVAEIQARLQRQGPSGEVRRQLEGAEAELEAFYLRVRQDQPLFRNLRYPQPADLAAIQRVLQPSERLVQYFLAEPRSHLWIVSPDRVRWRALPPRSEIDQAVRAAYGRMVDPAREPRDLGQLADWLIAPIAETGEREVSLLIVPSGSLYYFPLDLLPFGDGGDSLADVAATTYLPSASTLVVLRDRAVATPADRLLAVGDPAYATPGADRESDRQPDTTGRLPHTRTEVMQIADLFGTEHATVLLGAAASEAGFKGAAGPGFSVVHIAAHGRVDTDHPERSALLFADSADGTEDGLLQIREIYRLPLDAGLVTLSACRTAVGDLATGEGMIGLSRAFHYAGAESVVASLWNVNDEATSAFMASFYRRLQRGVGKAEALRGARLELKRSARYAHPYYWAPYVLIGEGADGVRFPPKQPSFRRLTPLLLGALGLALLALLIVRRRDQANRIAP